MNRRAVLRAFSASLGTGFMHAIPGAGVLQAASCPNACRSMIGENDVWIRDLPIIDTHCHVFNARDIPSIHFITKVVLKHYAAHLSAANRRTLETEIGEAVSGSLGRTPGYELEKSVLEARLAGEPEAAALAKTLELPKFAHGSKRSCYGADVADNITAVLNLITILTQFRHKNFEALMSINTEPQPGVGVALYTPAMVDMDYWLGVGAEAGTPADDIGTDASSLRQSSPAQQVELMEMIQRLYPGRCHGFVSFCPWRQVDGTYHNALIGEGSPRRRRTALEVVEDAILNRGFAGVKLYPPMGFLPMGNADIPPEGFPASVAETPYAEEFGHLLDAALLALYEFCAAHDVPVMVHTAPSNGAGVFTNSAGKEMGYEARAHPQGWERVLARQGLSGLKLNLAHFGGSLDAARTMEWRASIGKLMDDYENVYTDLSHYPEMLMDNFTGAGQHCREAAQMLAPIRKVFLPGEAGEKRARRILYGSDWSLLSKEYYYADYLPVVAHMYRRKIYGVGEGAEMNARAFLSHNAIEFLGLRMGDKARARFEAWYARHGLDPAPLKRFDTVGE
ncbi:MAG: amidohydrolase family protein [Alphaproteobacteria bacterium]